MSGKIDKQFRPFVKKLLEIDDLELVEPRGNNHVKIVYCGRYVGSLPTSASSRNGVRDLARQLRRHGVPL